LAAGSRLGPYEVVASIGAGGMGEVYLARDTTLHRDVALKVLPEAFASDPDRLARFAREAQLLASLNHPNIAAIYGFHDNALVLELVEGPTLADRIASGPLPLDEALPIARQIADALDAAHEHGVIHRDLKPSNIKVRPDGTVKVLDFGLAKALEPVNGSSEVSRSPTITSPAMTRMGMVLGTAAYMSPEQARGHPADRRSDVWAFGCVLYEMLTATRVFDMREMSDTIAAVLRAEPDWTKLSAQVPEPITTLLHRCLEKDSRRRLRDIGDARLELEARAESTGSDPIDTASRRRERIVWTAAVALLVLAALGLGAWAIRPPPASAEVRLTIETPGETDPRDLASLAVSPDGLNVAFVAAGYTQLELLPVFAKNESGVTEKWIGFIFLASSVALVVCQLPIAKLVEGRARMRSLAVMPAVWAIAWLVVAAGGAWLEAETAALVFGLAAVAFAIGECLDGPTRVALIADLVPEHLQGRYWALSANSWDLGYIIGPAVGGFVLAAAPLALWPLAAAVCIGAAVATRVLERAIPVELRLTPGGTAAQARVEPAT
jgi:serine/threonine protein kinase